MTIRTAASARIGAGHAARTAAVARQLEGLGAEVRFACDPETVEALVDRGVPRQAISAMDRSATSGRAGESPAPDDAQEADARTTAALAPADVFLVDSYQLGAAWHRAARANLARIAAFDDLRDRALDADVVVNAAAEPADYRSLAPAARVLGGLRYAIIGDPARPPAAGPGTVLLAFGAADPGGLTESTLAALSACRIPAGTVVVQIGAEGRTRVAEVLRTVPGAVFAPAGPTSPGTPRVSIGAAGVGLLERMHAGIPNVVVVAAENQRALACAAERAGAAVVVRSAEEAVAAATRLLGDPEAMRRMSDAGRAAVDGGAAARIARELNRLAGVSMRRAGMDDARLLHDWRNHPSVRAVSHVTDEIPWEGHVRWLEASLARDDRHVLVAERRGRPVGTLRFDVAGACATVSIAVDPSLHGSGLGPAILDAGERWVRSHDGRVRRLRAEIRPGNEASVRAFLAAGYLGGPETYERALGRGSEP